MFERNRVDRLHEPERTATTVEILLRDGETILGRMHMATTRSLGDELNTTSGFIEFEGLDGEKHFLSKSVIKAVRPKVIPKADHLQKSQLRSDAFSPWAILGVAENSSKDVVREAFHRLVKLYHPDRFATTDLPKEVADYLNAMSRRINAAYSALNAGAKREPTQAGG
jgi:DnaJ-domain-containing protein 1